MSKKLSRWIFATAGLGQKNYVDAANRLANQVDRFNLFSQIEILDEKNLQIFCPKISEKYGEYLNPHTRGYGFMSWKSEFVLRILERNKGAGLIWADCGCEASVNWLTTFKLRKLFKKNERDGYLAFTLDTRESTYTKRDLYNYFPTLEADDESPQFQTTFFGLAGSEGLQIAHRWFSVVIDSIETVNEEISERERKEFLEHRHDQSVFSLVMKERGKIPNLATLRNGRGSSIRQIFAQQTEPFLAARNRSGRSILRFDAQQDV